MHASVRFRALAATLGLLLSLAGLLTLGAPAHAAGTPNLSATIDSTRVLHGETVPVRFTVSNPAGQPYGYNLSYRVVLPEGVTYRGGGPVAPTQIAGPGRGETTLIFRNVSDLSRNATNVLAFEVDYDPGVYDVGDRFDVTAEAFANSDPRHVPRFDGGGAPVGPAADSYTGWTAPLTGTTTINAIEVEKDEPSWEGEILRGVHDHQTVYTVTVRNNEIRPTTGVDLVDYLPAGLEFLGCGGAGVDNSSAEEYPGAGEIDVESLAGCVAPLTVETVDVDPDGAGPLPRAVYTKVTWDAGTLAPGAERRFRYRAAIPIRENTMDWGGAAPAIDGAQAVNLDNNNGPETRDEQELTNYATASGDYDGRVSVTDGFHLTRTAEDWVVHKEGSTDQLAQGGLTTWTLTFETSEYRSVRDATVTDTVPNGLCPLGAINHTTENSADDDECDPVPGELPTAPYTDVTENSDGTFTVTWDADDFPELAQTGVSDRFTLRFTTRTRANWQRDFEPTTPILTRDTIENRVRTEGVAVVRCIDPTNCDPSGTEIVHDDGYGTGTTLPDESSAGQVAERPVIEKRVAESGTQCTTATYVTTVPVYHPGDRVCWKLHVTFPVGVDTSPQAIRDFLPPGATFEAGQEGPLNRPNGLNDVNATFHGADAANGLLAWTVDSGTVPTGRRVFERWFSTIVEPAGPNAVNGEVLGNLMKFASENTAGVSEPLRDARDIRLVTPVVDLVKGVQSIERSGRGTVGGPFPADTDHRVVQALDRVTYRLDVTNSGGQDAENVTVWDVLPSDYDCTLPGVTDFSHGGICLDGGADPDRIVWTLPTLARGATTTLTYTAVVPHDIGPARQLHNRAGVTAYSGRTNLDGDYWYYPADNIDPDNAPRANAPAADDPSDVYTNDAAISKSATTSVAETGNARAGQATIGEEITYTVRVTIPAGTTLGSNAVVTDLLDSATRQPYVSDSASATLDGAPLPAGFTLDDSGATPVVRFPDGFRVAPGDRDAVLEISFRTLVADVAANARGTTQLSNTATLRWTDPDAGNRTRTTPAVRTTIVEPRLSQSKSDDRNPDRVIPGEIVAYTVRTSNASGTGLSTAHQVVVTDVVPRGLTPVGSDGRALGDGDAVPETPGAVWDETTRTITYTIASLAPGASSELRYRARVDDPAIGGAELTNRAAARTQSLPDTAPGRRTTGADYAASSQDTVRIQGALVAKSVTPTTATIGEQVRYELRVSIPANIALYDVTVTDLLPQQIAFDDYVEERCLSGCDTYAGVQTYDAVARGDGTTTIAWDLGDIIDPLEQPREVLLTYTGHVKESDGAGDEIVAGDTAVNVATVGSNRSDRGGFDPTRIPTTFEDRSPETRATVTVIEPRLSIDKQVQVGSGSFSDGPATAHADDTLTYQLVVRNSGGSPAHDVTVTDRPDVELTDVTPIAQAGVSVTKEWSAADREIRWLIDGPIPANGSRTLRYTARFVAADQLGDGQAADNTAAIPSYFGIARSERDDHPEVDYRDYDDGGSDDVRVLLDFPTLELTKTTGLGAGPSYPETGNAEVGQAYPWRVVVRNTSATAAARAVVVTDTLPANWSYATGSSSGAAEPEVTRNASGDRLEWTIDSLAPSATVAIAYSAVPSPAAADQTGGLDPAAHVNTALVSSARDEAGNSGNADGPYGTPEDDASATLRVPELTIAKTPKGGAAVAGTASSFAIAVRNDGEVSARNVEIADVLPAGLRYEDDSATSVPAGAITERSVDPGPGAGETTIVWHVDELAAGATTTITLPVTVDADVPDGTTLTNRASARSDEKPGPVEDTGSLDVAAETDLSIVKSGDDRYVPGEGYEWRLRVRNLGPSDAQDVVVTDPLPAGTSFVSADGGCTHAAGTVRCEIGTAPVGYDRTFTLRVAVDEDATGPLENTATVATTTTDTDPDNDRSTHGPTADPLADVTVEKTAEPSAIARFGQTVFTLTVRNVGPSVARDVELEDALPAGLGFVAVDDNRCTEAAGTIGCAFGDLPVDAPIVVRITATGELEGAWTNTATVTTTTPQPPGGGEPDSDDAIVNVGPVAELGIVKSGPATVAAGGEITWRLEVTNNGPDPATGVTVTDALPAGTTFVAASAGCAEAGGTVTCAVGDLAVGESAALEITATAPIALASTTVVNTAAVRGDQIDEDPSNDRDEAITEIGPSTDLAIVKQGPAEVAAGGTAAWTLVVTNHGPSTATGVVVADALPAGVTFGSATPTQGAACTAVGQQVTCPIGTLAAGASAQVQVTGAVDAALEGQTLVNVAAVTGEQPDPNPGNDRSELPTRVGPPDAGNYDLALDKRLAPDARPALGATFGYELAVTNAGPAKGEAVTVTDTVPKALKVRSANVPGGSCSVRGQLVRCALGTVAAGETRTVALRVTALAAGTVRNTATVAAQVADRDPANDRSTATVRIAAPRAALRLQKRVVGRASVRRGAVVRYRIRATNASRNAAAGVVVCDRLPRGLAVRSKGGGRLRRGNLCWTVGMLPGRASRTFTFSARVLSDASGVRIANVATVTASNAPRRRARAVVRISDGGILPGFARGGGVTG
ncbi:DUF11 domain-containing protein [Conexibacter arvalis]|uniref:Putative repeat protein (TIGR01451 family)/fimbrial isopeptide formation D2 family protein n=1 Tax=Conexibacter arvalis TaxID=912552 RepID=A0A840II97_9ACTN|nr:DUF11 domain-containing protein [Conexibacter arvalis]MBB4663764.1 putative repeat protein (TIGR01451 family)/fimbrial isopeptide formation D2 family protein [Conexibacter arvalis]